jgi:multiple sugar transport system permease protein
MARALQQSRRRALPVRAGITYLAALLFAVYLVAPFAWQVITSITPEQEALSVPPHWLPESPTLDNYISFLAPTGRRAVAGGRGAENTPRALLNSTVVAGSVALINLAIGATAAYALARKQFRGASTLLLLYVASRMVPGIVIMLSVYLLIQSLGLLDSLGALVIMHTTFTLPFSIWLLRGYFAAVPPDLDDAARVDGCSWFQLMWKILLPLSAPGLAAVAMFSFLGSWSEFLFALLLTSTMNSKTIPIVVSEFVTDQNIDYGFLAASGVLAVIPPVLLALFFQRWIVQGLVAGSGR